MADDLVKRLEALERDVKALKANEVNLRRRLASSENESAALRKQLTIVRQGLTQVQTQNARQGHAQVQTQKSR